MPFIDSILKYKSVSIIGMEKNCGKTVVLNYILSRLEGRGCSVAVTSIGVDGEKKDAVTKGVKPEIILDRGVLFATAATFYAARNLVSEIIALGTDATSMGEVVISRVITKGKTMLGGVGDTPSMTRLIAQLQGLGADLVLVDGALSRKSLASPTVTEATVLCTGAALTLSIDKLISDTKHTYTLMCLPEFKGDMNAEGVVSLDGMLTDKMLDTFTEQGVNGVIVRDFTRLFISSLCYRKFLASGAQLYVQRSSKPIAVCVNPVSPSGYVLNSEVLIARLESELGVAVYDVKKIICNEI